MNIRWINSISFRRYFFDEFDAFCADMYCLGCEMAMTRVLLACAWLLPGGRGGKTFLAPACCGWLDEMQGIIGAPKRQVVGEKSQDLLREQALALKFFSETSCEMR